MRVSGAGWGGGVELGVRVELRVPGPCLEGLGPSDLCRGSSWDRGLGIGELRGGGGGPRKAERGMCAVS